MTIRLYRKAFLQEDEGKDQFVRVFWSQEELENWADIHFGSDRWGFNKYYQIPSKEEIKRRVNQAGA